MNATVEVESLEREILFLYKTLADYGYFMGDMAPRVMPWRVFGDDRGAVLLKDAEPWLTEGSLLLALTVLWGERDRAHSIDGVEAAKITSMIEALRSHSERTAEIAAVIDMVRHEQDDDVVVRRSQSLYRKYVVGYLKDLAARAADNAQSSDDRAQ